VEQGLTGLRRLNTIALFLLVTALAILLQFNILPSGVSFSSRMHTLNKLKNRTRLPQQPDYDHQVTLNALLQPGDDSRRWSETSAARVEGYVVAVRAGSVESANCYSLLQRDTHIEVALSKDAPPRERMELEVTPRMSEWAKRQGWDWSTGVLASELVGHWCQFEGWLLFDTGHDEESENTNLGGGKNWRATAWELHPVTSIKVVR
jgi:hypothetical protein